MYLQLFQDVVGVYLYRVGGELEVVGYAFGGKVLRDQSQDFHFTGGEVVTLSEFDAAFGESLEVNGLTGCKVAGPLRRG